MAVFYVDFPILFPLFSPPHFLNSFGLDLVLLQGMVGSFD